MPQEPQVAAVLSRLDTVDGTPVEAHIEVFESVYSALADLLDSEQE